MSMDSWVLHSSENRYWVMETPVKWIQIYSCLEMEKKNVIVISLMIDLSSMAALTWFLESTAVSIVITNL